MMAKLPNVYNHNPDGRKRQVIEEIEKSVCYVS